MFSVKATYNGEIRRFSFQDSTTFPTFEQLYSQLNRVFPSSNNYYLSKLIFSPDASKPGRILIGGQVRNAEDYNRCIVAFRGRSWSNASLRFYLVNGSPDMAPSHFISQIVGQLPREEPSPPSSIDATFRSMSTPRPLYTSKHPVTFAIPPRASSDMPTDIDMRTDASINADTMSNPTFTSDATFRDESSEAKPSCCSPAQVKKDVEDLLKNFQKDLERTVSQLSGSSTPVATAGTAASMSQTWPVWQSPQRSPTLPSANAPFIPPLPLFDYPTPQAPSTLRNTTPSLPVAVPPPPVIHLGVFCDSCNLTIEGVRHKCLDCPDYDLCALCIEDGAHQRHNAQHQLLEITEPGRVIVHNVNLPEDRTPLPNTAPPVSTAPTLPVVHNAICDLCDSMITGSRYKCIACPDFDTCESCFTITNEQHPLHAFVKISKEEDYISRERAPNQRHLARCDACDKTIEGVRYKCMHRDCPDFDLCEKCEALPISQHPSNHPMLKMRSPETVIPTVYRSSEDVIPFTSPSNISQPVSQTWVPTTGYAVVEPGSMIGEPLNEPFNLAPRPTSRYDHCLYPISPYRTSPQEACLEPDVHPPASEQLTSEPQESNSFGPDSRIKSAPLSPLPASPALLDVVDTPAVPGSWYGTGLSGIINGSPEELPPSEHESDHGVPDQPLKVPVVADSYLENASLLQRPPTPSTTQMCQVLPTNSQSLSEISNRYDRSMSELILEDNVLQESSDIFEAPLVAGHVEDITAPDGQIFAPGVTFIKVWRMVNTGTRDWPADTEVVFVGGAQLANGNPPPHIQPKCLVGPLKSGEEKNIWTPELKAPDASGRYTSYWRLRDDKGQLFGDSIWVEIEVVNPSCSNSNEAVTSSSMIIMPDPPSPLSPAIDQRAVSRSPSNDTEDASDDYLSDSSSISVVSMPCSEDDADATLWAESRVQEDLAHDRAQATADYIAEHASQAMDYVLLYDDDNTSEEE